MCGFFLFYYIIQQHRSFFNTPFLCANRFQIRTNTEILPTVESRFFQFTRQKNMERGEPNLSVDKATPCPYNLFMKNLAFLYMRTLCNAKEHTLALPAIFKQAIRYTRA